MKLLIDHTKHPLKISRLEGDAVVSYTLPGVSISGQTLVEKVEDTYVAFKRAIEVMALNNSCGCNACANISTLDLKFFVHYGTFGLQRLGEHEELVGSDVNLIHRLLKNSVVETTGVRAYTLYTEAAIGALGLQGMASTLTEHRETYEHLGAVTVFIQDMGPVWQDRKKAEVIRLAPSEVLLEVDGLVNATPEVVWDRLGRPEFRKVLIGSERQEVQGRQNGRIAADSAFQCFHGDRVVTQTILEWIPFERVVTRDRVIADVHVLTEYELRAEGEATRLFQRVGRPSGNLLLRGIVGFGLARMRKAAIRDLDAFARVVEADSAPAVEGAEP